MLPLLVAATLAGCSVAASASSTVSRAPTSTPLAQWGLGLNNWTTLTVSVFVNNTFVKTFGPNGGTAGEDSFDHAGLPPLPWRVEARTEGGRVLATLDVPHPPNPLGFVSLTGLSCGRILLYTGQPPIGEPVLPSGYGSFPPGDCAP